MRRLIYLATLAMLAMLVLAPAALAQESFTDPDAVLGGTCPEGFSAFGDPGTGELTCLTPEDLAALEAGTLDPASVPEFGAADGICVGSGEGDPDCAEALLESVGTQPAPAPTSTGTEAMPSQSYAVMPDTGGPSLLLPVAALLVGSGLLGFAAVRRIK